MRNHTGIMPLYTLMNILSSTHIIALRLADTLKHIDIPEFTVHDFTRRFSVNEDCLTGLPRRSSPLLRKHQKPGVAAERRYAVAVFVLLAANEAYFTGLPRRSSPLLRKHQKPGVAAERRYAVAVFVLLAANEDWRRRESNPRPETFWNRPLRA